MKNTDSIKKLIGTFVSELTTENLGCFIIVEKPEGGYAVGGNLPTDSIRKVLEKVDKRDAEKSLSLQHEEQM